MLNFNDDNSIQQSERLYTVRPRSISYDQAAGGGGNRGTRARFRILSSDPSRTQSNARGSFANSSSADYVSSRMLNTNVGAGYTDFLLTDVNVNFDEKVQITQTFGDNEVVYYFGKAPVIFNLSGILIDDIDNQWFTNFMDLYANMARGTVLAKNYELFELILPNMIVIGTIMGAGYNQNSARDTDIPFTMRVLAKEVRPVPIQMPSKPLNTGVALLNFKKAMNFTNFKSITEINDTRDSLGYLQKLVQNPLASTGDISKVFNQFGGVGTAAMGMMGGNTAGNSPYTDLISRVANTGGSIGQAMAASISPNSIPNIPGLINGEGSITALKEAVPGLTIPFSDSSINAIKALAPTGPGDLSNVGNLAAGTMGSLAGSVTAAGEGFAGKVGPIGESLMDKYGGQFETASNSLSGSAETMINGIAGANFFGPFSKASAAFGKSVGNTDLGGSLAGIPDDLGFDAPVNSLAATVKGGISASGGAVLPAGSKSGNPFGSVLPSLGGIGGGVLGGMFGGIFGTSTSSGVSLGGFQSSLFSPVFGVLTSITKVVSSVTGSISGIISSFTNPVNTILRDIRSVAGQAIRVANMITSSVNSIVNIPLRTANEFRTTINSLKNMAGVISRVPETIGQSIKRLTHFGPLKGGASFLTKGGSAPGSKTALLNSGKPYTAASGARLR